MYTEFFGLNEKPFAITPDPRYLYMSVRHTDALAHLLYGISESGGFIQLTGEVGTGKTTLIRSLLEQLPAKADIALILSPQLTTVEFLATIIQELHCAAAGGANGQSAYRRLERAFDECALRRTARRADRRRGADALSRAARASTVADEPRDVEAKAAADHLDRPARAARAARSARDAADRAAHHGALSLGAAAQGRHARLCHPSAARRRRPKRYLHEARDQRTLRLLARYPATHQRHRRSRVARRLHEGPPQRRRETRRRRRRTRYSASGARPRGGPSQPRRPASRP